MVAIGPLGKDSDDLAVRPRGGRAQGLEVWMVLEPLQEGGALPAR